MNELMNLAAKVAIAERNKDWGNAVKYLRQCIRKYGPQEAERALRKMEALLKDEGFLNPSKEG